MIATVVISALRHASAFQPVSPVFARRAASSLHMASDNDFDDFSSKVSANDILSNYSVLKQNIH